MTCLPEHHARPELAQVTRHGIYCDGDMVSRENVRGLQVQPGWSLLSSRDRQHFYLCLKGGAHYDAHVLSYTHRAVRATAAVLSSGSDW